MPVWLASLPKQVKYWYRLGSIQCYQHFNQGKQNDCDRNNLVPESLPMSSPNQLHTDPTDKPKIGSQKHDRKRHTFPPLCKWPFSDSELQKEDCDLSFQLESKLHAELGILYLLLKHVCSGLNCLSFLSSFRDAKSILRTFYMITAPLSFCQFLSNYIH